MVDGNGIITRKIRAFRKGREEKQKVKLREEVSRLEMERKRAEQLAELRKARQEQLEKISTARKTAPKRGFLSTVARGAVSGTVAVGRGAAVTAAGISKATQPTRRAPARRRVRRRIMVTRRVPVRRRRRKFRTVTVRAPARRRRTRRRAAPRQNGGNGGGLPFGDFSF